MDTGCAVDGVRPAAAAPNVLESYDIQRSLEPSEASTRRFSLEIFLHVLVHFSRKGNGRLPRDVVHVILRAVPWKYCADTCNHHSSVATSGQVAAASSARHFVMATHDLID